MDRAEKFWDRIAKNFDKSEKRFEQIHLKTLENSKKYLDVDDIETETIYHRVSSYFVVAKKI